MTLDEAEQKIEAEAQAEADFPPEMTPYMKAWIRAHIDWIAKEISIHKTGATVADRADLNP